MKRAVPHSSGGAHVRIANDPPGRRTLVASPTAAAGSAAYWNAQKPVTTSNASSAQGSASISPTTKSPSGTRPRAMSIAGGAASIPLTNAPAARAIDAATPDPQPTSSRRVAAWTPAAANTGG
jgi:hypothetical protein